MSAEDSALAIGVDLGGTATRFVSLNDDSEVVFQFIEGTPSQGSKESVVRFLVDNIRRLTAEQPIGSIGIGASGPIDAKGIIRNDETLPAFSNIDLIGKLELELDHRPTIDNDAVTAAIGEYRLGSGRGAKDVLMVTLGTGVGVCLLQDGKPFKATSGQHPEASHVSLVGVPAPCYCGRLRCWEQTASRTALQESASALIDHPTLTSRDIDRALGLAEAGDERSRQMFASYGHSLGEGLLTLISAYGPDRVIIGGSGSNYLDGYEPALRQSLEQITGIDAGMIFASELGEYGGAIGASLVATSTT